MDDARQIELLGFEIEKLKGEALEDRDDVRILKGRCDVHNKGYAKLSDEMRSMTKARDTVSEWLAERDTEVLDLKAQLKRTQTMGHKMETHLGLVRDEIGDKAFRGILWRGKREAGEPEYPGLRMLTIETSGATDNVEVTVAGSAVNALARPGDEPFVGVTPASEREGPYTIGHDPAADDASTIVRVVAGTLIKHCDIKHCDRIDGGPVCLDARYVREPGKVLVWEYLVRVWLGRFTIIHKGCPVVLGADGQTLYITPDDRAEPWGVVVEGWSASDSLTEGELWVRRMPSNADAKPEQPRILQTINVPVPGDTLRERLAVHVHSPKGHDICSGQLLFYDGGDSLTTEPTHTSRSWGIVTGWEEISVEPRWFRAWVERAAE